MFRSVSLAGRSVLTAAIRGGRVEGSIKVGGIRGRSGKLALSSRNLDRSIRMLTRSFCNTDGKDMKKEGEAKRPTDEELSEKYKKSQMVHVDYDDQDDFYEEPRTAGEKVRFWTKVAFQLGLLGAGLFCITLTARELFPGRMNPNSLFSEVFDLLRNNDNITLIVGEDPKGFGRDTGRNTEGRRNHIDSFTYEAEDGSTRMRIRFNIKGKKGQVLVWVEVSDKMAGNEYVYIICQNIKTGRVLTIEDERDRIEEEWKEKVARGEVTNNKFLANLPGLFKGSDESNSQSTAPAAK